MQLKQRKRGSHYSRVVALRGFAEVLRIDAVNSVFSNSAKIKRILRRITFCVANPLLSYNILLNRLSA